MILIKRRDGVRPLVPLTWCPVRERLPNATPGRPITATMTCSRNHEGSLVDHEIAADGTITPSVVCPEPGCDWHEMAQLEDWQPV